MPEVVVIVLALYYLAAAAVLIGRTRGRFESVEPKLLLLYGLLINAAAVLFMIVFPVLLATSGRLS